MVILPNLKIETTNNMKEVIDFLEANGFEKKETDTYDYVYGNGKCDVAIDLENEYYVVANAEGEMCSDGLNIYWLIGVLTYYGHMSKNYIQLNEIYKPKNTSEEINVGDPIIVMGDLKTIVERVEGEKYYFKDESGKIWQENRQAIELNKNGKN